MELKPRLFLLAILSGCSSPIEPEIPPEVCEAPAWETALFPMVEGRTWTYEYEVVESGEQYSPPGPVSPPSRRLDAVLRWTLEEVARLRPDGEPVSARACHAESQTYRGRIREVATGQLTLVKRDDRDTMTYVPRDTTWTTQFDVLVARNLLAVERYLDVMPPLEIQEFGIAQDTLSLDLTLSAGFGGWHGVEVTLNPGEGIGVFLDLDNWRGGSLTKRLLLRK